MNQTTKRARMRHALLTFALVGGTMAAVGAAPQSASADAPDQLAVVQSAGASSKDFGPENSIRTLNTDGSTSFAAPVLLPVADGDGQNAFGLSGGSNGNGTLSRSVDGNYLSVAGYHHAPGNAGAPGVDPKDSTSASIQRMVARITNTGTIDTSTILATSVLSTGAPRAAISADGSSFYVSGNNGSDSPKSGVVRVNLGGSGKTAIADTNQTNVRQVQIAGGNLYATSEKKNLYGFGKFNSAGLPAAATALNSLAVTTTNTSGTPKPISDAYVPDAFVVLDANGSVPGVDTAYIAIQAFKDDAHPDDPLLNFSGEIRKYTSDGTTWSQAGTGKVGDFPFMTARVLEGGNVELFATKGSAAGNSVVRFSDANPTGNANYGSESTVGTAPAGSAIRGVAFPPTGWDPGTATSEGPSISSNHDSVGGVIGDPHNPGNSVTVADPDTTASALTVTAKSDKQSAIPDGNITVTGTGATRSVAYNPTGVGRANITFTVTDDNNNKGTALVSYGASAAPSSSSGRYLYESSDLSTAVDVGDGYLLTGSSDGSVRLHKGDESGRSTKDFDFSANLGTDGPDIEGMARANDTLYVFGSHSNKKNGDLDPERSVVFTAAIAGTGASTELTFVAKRTDLRDALKTWDVSKGNALGFASGQAAGKDPRNADGFNIEGFEFAPGSTTTGYIAFRSPVVGGKAVIVPWTNLGPLLGGTPTFANAIKLDLGGRSIREIRKNSDDEYLISAQGDSQSPQWKLFAWNGSAETAPISVASLPNPDSARTGAWEAIVSVPSNLPAGKSVTLIADSGNTTFYGDSTQGSDEKKGLSKSYVDEFTTNSFTPVVFGPPSDLHSTSTTSSSVNLAWTKVAGATDYIVSQGKGSDPRTAKHVGDVASASYTGLAASTAYTYDIIAVKANATESAASAPRVTVTTAAAVADRPTNLQVTSRTATALSIEWTKKPGAAKYRIKYIPASGGSFKYLTVGNVSAAEIIGLTRGVSYKVRVTAIAADGTQSPYSTTITKSTSNLLPPTQFAKKSITSTTIKMNWVKAAGASGYRIYYGIGTGPRTKVEVSGGDAFRQVISGLKPNTTYTIDIASTEDGGTSRSSYTTPRVSVKTSK